jgi:hypothetical protein
VSVFLLNDFDQQYGCALLRCMEREMVVVGRLCCPLDAVL